MSRANLVNSSFDEAYTYDGLNQLTGFVRDTHTQDWDYDALGNFDAVTVDGGTPETRTANAQNEITSISGLTTPTYDANGNMTTDQNGLKFYYDAWNRLVEVQDDGNTTLETFSYDGTNRRMTNTVASTTTDLYYSSQWQVLEEQIGGSDVNRYFWSPAYVNAMVLRDRATTTPGTLNERLWAQQDANWNTTALVDSSWNGAGTVYLRLLWCDYGLRWQLHGAGWRVELCLGLSLSGNAV